MTAIREALKDAGVKLPLNRRVWNWVKDHPGKTAKEIALGLNEPAQKVYNAVADIECRGMVIGKPVYRSRYTGFGPKTAKEYTAVGDRFELLPTRKKSPGPSSSVTVVKSGVVMQHPSQMTAVDVAKPASTHHVDVDALPLAEARRVYLKLREIFGDKYE